MRFQVSVSAFPRFHVSPFPFPCYIALPPLLVFVYYHYCRLPPVSTTTIFHLTEALKPVASTIVQKLSTQQPSLERRLKVLKETSAEICVTLHLEEDVCKLAYLNILNCLLMFHRWIIIFHVYRNKSYKSLIDQLPLIMLSSVLIHKNVATTTRDAFESATYAAMVARTASELLRSESQDYDTDNDGGGFSH
ncbi:uncharacterized protein LOC123220848 [Mangifera indica]|uniref:uncharacterized protein LOC123220848 n=1 Tax=Mangifera indica TaxID=29780 RepID=UPI001CF9E164|nr:uncharacterized protein LOC123220848 [Mangifera indica]